METGPEGINWSKLLTKQRSKGNTGAKGVKADFEEATRIKTRMNESDRLKKREHMKAMGRGNRSTKAAQSYSATNGYAYEADDESDEYDDFLEDEDERALEAFRAMRMKQLMSASAVPQYGRFQEVGKYEFLDEVDHADARTFVVVHLMEDYILACQRMNECLHSLAPR